MRVAMSVGHLLRFLLPALVFVGVEIVERSFGIEANIRCVGRIRSVSGEPISAAEVWLVEVVAADWPLVLAKTRTDEHGEFNATVTMPPGHQVRAEEAAEIAPIAGPDWNIPPIPSRHGWLPGYDFGMFADPVPRCLQIWVRSTSHELGWSAPLPVNSFVRTTIVMQPVADRSGVLQAADGSLVRAPRVGLVGLPSRDGSGRLNSGSHYCLMPREWSESYSISAAADGHFDARAWPTADVLVIGRAEGLAELMMTWPTSPASRDDAQAWKLRLVPAKPLRGQVRGMHLEDLPDQLSLLHREAVHMSNTEGNVDGIGIHLATTMTQEREFFFENAPKRVSRRDRNAIFLNRPDFSQKLQGTQRLTYFTALQEVNEQPVLFVYRVARVRGRVIDEQTGLPVPGAEVDFDFAESPQDAPDSTPFAITDGAGTFERTIPIANYWIKTSSTGSASPKPSPSKFPLFPRLNLPPLERQIDWKQLQPGRTLDIPDIQVPCPHHISVTVIDSLGQPIPDAELLVELRNRPMEPYSRTDREGRFVIPLQEYFSGISVRARHGELVGESTHLVRVPGRVPKNELTLEVKPETTTRIVGTIVDAEGLPLESRPVIVWREVYRELDPREHTTQGRVVETLLTGSDGRFRSSPLGVGEAYYVQVRGAHGETFNTHRLAAAAESTIDMGRVTVPNRRVKVTGRVLDPMGTPVADAIVGTLGPQSRSTTTGPDGLFQLDDLSDFGEVIYIEHLGFRPVARIVREPNRDLGIRVIGRNEVNPNSPVAVERFDEPQPLPRLLSTLASQDRESVERAQRAVALLRTLPDSPSFVRQQLVEILSRIAPLEAIDLYSKGSAGRGFTSPILDAFVNLAEDDPARATEALQRMAMLDATDVAGRLADWYSSRDPKKAALFADHFLARHAPKQSEFDSPLQLAWAGHWKIERGEREAGMDALSRAAQILEDGPKKHRSYLREDVQTVDRLLRQHAPALAKRITGAMPNYRSPGPNELNWSELRPETAREWLDRVDSRRLAPPNFGRPSDVRLLQQVAKRDAPTAARLAGFLGRMRHQGEYRWLLATVALWNQSVAWDLIDEDLYDLRRLDAEFWSGRRAPQSRFEQAARLLVAGTDVGYPDLDTLVANCFAFRERVIGPAGIVLHRTDSLLSGLAALSLVAPEVARPLVEDFRVAMPKHLLGSGFRSSFLGRSRSGVSRADWYIALALTDPDAVQRLLEEEVAYFIEHPPRDLGIEFGRVPNPLAGITASADLWTTPQRERWRFLRNRPGW